MSKLKGEGRTRLGRFAMVAVPSAVVSAGLGVAIVQGMISATLASADAFTLQSNQISSDSLKVAAGGASVGSTTPANKEAIYAETGASTVADGVHITALTPSLPILGKVAQIKIDSSDHTVSLPGVVLNAKDLTVSDKDAGVDGTDATNSAAALSDVKLGITEQQAGVTAANDPAYNADAFALQSGQATLNNVNADAYAITLSGLALDDLSLGISLQ